MGFRETQEGAERATRTYLLLFCALTLAAGAWVELGWRWLWKDHNPFVWPVPALSFIALTVAIALLEYLRLSYGGGHRVARLSGAKGLEVNRSEGRKLLHVVEEMALAADVPLPAIYLLQCDTINAFAAGMTPEDSVLVITQGALDKLSRDELQAVVAHEIGHIQQRDMRVGLALAALVMGFYWLFYLGQKMLRAAHCFRRDKKERGRALAFGVMVIGAFAYLFGLLLKAAVSRQREYRADASSVQFTRHPAGLIGALRKVAAEASSKMPEHHYSHLYFNHPAYLFKTHPPIEKRIAALEGQ